MRSSVSDISDYRNFCQIASENDAVFKGFRRNYLYNHILEHVTKEQGRAYLDIIKQQMGPQDMAELSYSDDVGSPMMYYYNEYGSWSPTTLRYIKVMLDLCAIHGPLHEMKIIEIGGGYGGQCNIIKHFFQNCDYHIYDLPEALDLTYLFLTECGKSATLHNALEEIEENECDLLISNYAISEVIKPLQDQYFDKVISFAKHGYITYNLFDGAYTIDEFSKKLSNLSKDVRRTEETPLTYPGNEIITW